MRFVFKPMWSKLIEEILSNAENQFNKPLWLIQMYLNEPELIHVKIVTKKRPYSELLPPLSNNTDFYSVSAGFKDNWQIVSSNDFSDCLDMTVLSKANLNDLLAMLEKQGFKTDHMLLPNTDYAYEDTLYPNFWDTTSLNLPHNLSKLAPIVMPTEVIDHQSIVFGNLSIEALNEALLKMPDGYWIIRQSLKNLGVFCVARKEGSKVISSLIDPYDLNYIAKETGSLGTALIVYLTKGDRAVRSHTSGNDDVFIYRLEHLLMPSLTSFTNYNLWNDITTDLLENSKSPKGSNRVINSDLLPSTIHKLVFDAIPSDLLKKELLIRAKKMPKVDGKEPNLWLFSEQKNNTDDELLIVSCHKPDEKIKNRRNSDALICGAEMKGYSRNTMIFPIANETSFKSSATFTNDAPGLYLIRDPQNDFKRYLTPFYRNEVIEALMLADKPRELFTGFKETPTIGAQITLAIKRAEKEGELKALSDCLLQLKPLVKDSIASMEIEKNDAIFSPIINFIESTENKIITIQKEIEKIDKELANVTDEPGLSSNTTLPNRFFKPNSENKANRVKNAADYHMGS